MKKRLSDRFLETVKRPETGRDTYSDTLRPGLHLRVGSRKASWMFEKRVKGGKARKHTLGSYCSWNQRGERSPVKVTLSEARAMAIEIDAEATKGIDRVALNEAERLAEEKRRLEEELARAAQMPLETVVSRYEQIKLRNLRTGSERGRELRKYLQPYLPLPANDLTKAHLQQEIDAKALEGRMVYANRIRSYLRAFTKWAAGRDYLETDIGKDLQGVGSEDHRDRVLSIDEVRRIYSASAELGSPWGPMFRLMLLTAQRRGEISTLRWSEVDLERRTITLEGQRTKNGKPHTTHLSRASIAELERIEQTGPYVFTTNAKTPSSGISKAKRRLDLLVGLSSPWRLHDFRRSMATALAQEGIPEGVVDRIQNHSAVGSAPSAVARVYQQSELLPQRAKALDLWADFVTKAKDPGGASHG